MVQEIGPVSLFQNSALGKALTDEFGIWQSTGLDRVNSNVYAKFHQKIPHGSRVMGNFHKLIYRGHNFTNWQWTRNLIMGR